MQKNDIRKMIRSVKVLVFTALITITGGLLSDVYGATNSDARGSRMMVIIIIGTSFLTMIISTMQYGRRKDDDEDDEDDGYGRR